MYIYRHICIYNTNFETLFRNAAKYFIATRHLFKILCHK